MEKKDGADAVFFVAVFPFNGFLWMFTPISWVISYKPYITAEIYRSNWIRGCKGQKRNQIDSLQQDLYIYIYGIPQFVISVQDDCASPTEQVLQRVKLTNSSEIICHPCLTKHVSISILSIFSMNFETSSHFLVSHARRAVPKVWKPVLLLSMRRRKAEWLHVWWRTDGGWPKISLVPQSSTVLERN